MNNLMTIVIVASLTVGGVSFLVTPSYGQIPGLANLPGLADAGQSLSTAFSQGGVNTGLGAAVAQGIEPGLRKGLDSVSNSLSQTVGQIVPSNLQEPLNQVGTTLSGPTSSGGAHFGGIPFRVGSLLDGTVHVPNAAIRGTLTGIHGFP